jgi:hypothetical protein
VAISTTDLQAFNEGFDKTIEVIEQGVDRGTHHFHIRVMISHYAIGRGRWYREGSEMAVRFCEDNWHKAKKQAITYRQAFRNANA